MSIWTEFRGEITLSGRKYDGKGFGLRSVWYPGGPVSGGTRRFYFHILRDGRLSRHYSREVFSRALEETNVPHGREGGSVIDILESRLDGCVHITFDRNLRDWIDSYEIRDWILGFVKARISEGWTVKCNISYGMDSLPKDRVIVLPSHQRWAVEDRHVTKNGHEDRIQSWKHDLLGETGPEMLNEYRSPDNGED